MAEIDTTANVAICNQALALLGAASIEVNGTSQNHTYCSTFFADARDEILASHRWNFAKKRANAIQTTDPLWGWDNAFTKPSDCINVLQISQTPDAKFEVEGNSILTDEGETPDDWATATAYLAGEMISNNDVTYLCATAHTSGDADDEPGVGADTATYWTSQSGDYEYLEVEYIYQHTTYSSWPVYAKQCFIINLARMLAAPIKQNENAAMNLQSMLYGGPRITGYLDLARSFDAKEGGIMTMKTETWISKRS